MSEFERARERAERKLAKKGIQSIADTSPAVEVGADPEIQLERLLSQIPKAPKKRSNEIEVSVWIDGNEYCFTFKTNITGTFMGTQQSHKGMQAVILEALRAKFGTVELI